MARGYPWTECVSWGGGEWLPARFLVALTDDLQARAVLADDAPVWVLEVGAGLGLFAHGLCAALRDELGSPGQALLARLRYVVSDIEADTVAAACAREPLASWVRAGVALPATCDIAEPQAVDCPGCPNPPPHWALVIANYVADTVPCKLLRRQAGHWSQAEVPTSEQADLAVVAEQMTWRAGALPAMLAVPAHAALVEQATLDMGDVSLPFAPVWWQFVDGCAFIVVPGGCLLVHDYGPVDAAGLRADRNLGPSKYGGAVSHELAWPLFDGLPAPWFVRRTTDSLASLHTAVARHGCPWSANLQDAFARIWVDCDRPETVIDLTSAAELMTEAGQHAAAARMYRRALGLDPRNPALLAAAAIAALSAGAWDQARQWLLLGREVDQSGGSDWDFELGRVAALADDPATALGHYWSSVQRDPNVATWTNIAELHATLGQIDAAAQAFRSALQVDADYERARQGLRRLVDRYNL